MWHSVRWTAAGIEPRCSTYDVMTPTWKCPSYLSTMALVTTSLTSPSRYEHSSAYLLQQYNTILLLLLLHPFNGLFSKTTGASRYQKGKTSLYLTRDDGVWDSSGINWSIYKQLAPRCRQITTPTPHHSIFTGRMLFLMPSQQCQSTDGT